MSRHYISGSLIDSDNPLSVIEVSGGDGTTVHMIDGARIDVDHPLAVTIISSGLKVARVFQYDFSVDGGTIGTIVLRDIDNLGVLPNHFIIQNAELDVITLLGSAGAATGAVTSGQLANDIVSATIVAGAPFSTTGSKATIPLVGTIGTRIKLTADRSPALVVAVANLNAGKFNLFIEGLQSS